MDETYTIRRNYFNSSKHDPVVLETGLSLEEAQAHCKDPNTSSRTCTDPAMLEHTAKYGPWFDSYFEE